MGFRDLKALYDAAFAWTWGTCPNVSKWLTPRVVSGDQRDPVNVVKLTPAPELHLASGKKTSIGDLSSLLLNVILGNVFDFVNGIELFYRGNDFTWTDVFA